MFYQCQFDQVGDYVNYELSMNISNGNEYVTVGRVDNISSTEEGDDNQPHYCITATTDQNGNNTIALNFYNASSKSVGTIALTGCTNILPGVDLGGN